MTEECGFVEGLGNSYFQNHIRKSPYFFQPFGVSLFLPILKFAFKVHIMHSQHKEYKIEDILDIFSTRTMQRLLRLGRPYR